MTTSALYPSFARTDLAFERGEGQSHQPGGEGEGQEFVEEFVADAEEGVAAID